MTTRDDLDPKDETLAVRQPSPACSFQSSEQLQHRYRAVFVPMWLRSSRLDYLGAGAIVSSYRLLDRCQARKKVPSVVRIGLLDPRSTADIERSALLLGRSPSAVRNQTLVSLIALHDAHHPDLRVHLLDGPVEGRIELLDGGAFVTPYVGANRFHASILHPAGTQAYCEGQAAIESALAGQRTLRLGVVAGRGSAGEVTVSGDDDLAELLVELGSQDDLAELRRRRDRRFEQIRRDVLRAFGEQVDYF